MYQSKCLNYKCLAAAAMNAHMQNTVYSFTKIFSSTATMEEPARNYKRKKPDKKKNTRYDRINSYTEILSCKLSAQRLESVVTEERAQYVPHEAQIRMYCSKRIR